MRDDDDPEFDFWSMESLRIAVERWAAELAEADGA